MKINLPELSLVVLIGASGCGKSTFARRYFKPTEIISSDFCRGLVADDENDQTATKQAFELLHTIASKRLEIGRLAVIDATNTQPEDRRPLVALAKEYHVVPVAIVFNLPESVCQERNRLRQDRTVPGGAVHRQIEQVKRSLRNLQKEGFRYVYAFRDPVEMDAANIERQALWTNCKHEHGPFDILGDLHGCCDELEQLLEKLGYQFRDEPSGGTYPRVYFHPEGRKAIFLGDLVDRGPRILDTVQLVYHMMKAGNALCVPGNHDSKVMRKLIGRDVQVAGMEKTLAELDALQPDEQHKIIPLLTEFLDGLVSHYVLDDGKLVVAHAGMKENMMGRASGKVRDFALYGETSGETDEFGLPIRHNWALEYRGKARVVYGHTPVVEPEWLNNTINIDTGCVFGGKLSALRYPELELVSVPAAQVYSEPVRPLKISTQEQLTVQQQQDELLDIESALGKHIIETQLMGRVIIPEGNSAAALEVMSRFIVNPKWLVYLPPTMSPPESTSQAGFLEHPAEAFAYYRKRGVRQVICEQKHMGSRLVAVLCKDDDTARRRFGIEGEGSGVLYTRTGRRFFDDAQVEHALIRQIQSALEGSGFWREFETDWVCLDCELMPWSVKAQELLQTQYAVVGMAARESLQETISKLEQGSKNGLPLQDLRAKFQYRKEMIARYVEAYRRYCWPVQSVNEMRLAPFHVMATEGAVHIDKSHAWHMAAIGKFVQSAPESCLYSTAYQMVDLGNPESEAEGITWWQTITDAGQEGMVVKPLDFVAREGNRLIQPAIKCRGREYLRIIYGPEYTTDDHLETLRQRSVKLKRTLALKEFSLGIEALQRFVNKQPLRNVHECVFGVLALESEAVDPRL
ncbi:MAG: polynucleotide kinase-phosphatase [Chloroflexota bacterium]